MFVIRFSNSLTAKYLNFYKSTLSGESNESVRSFELSMTLKPIKNLQRQSHSEFLVKSEVMSRLEDSNEVKEGGKTSRSFHQYNRDEQNFLLKIFPPFQFGTYVATSLDNDSFFKGNKKFLAHFSYHPDH